MSFFSAKKIFGILTSTVFYNLIGLSQKGHGIQIPWLEFTGSRVDENFIHLSLRVIEDPEAGTQVHHCHIG